MHGVFAAPGFWILDYQLVFYCIILKLCNFISHLIPYSAKRWLRKTLVNQSFQSFGEENVGKFNLLTNS